MIAELDTSNKNRIGIYITLQPSDMIVWKKKFQNKEYDHVLALLLLSSLWLYVLRVYTMVHTCTIDVIFKFCIRYDKW